MAAARDPDPPDPAGPSADDLSRRELLLRAAAGVAATAVGPAIAGCGSESAGGDGAATRIAAVGDWGSGSQDARAVSAAVRRFAQREGFDVLLTLGDNNYSDSVEGFEKHWAEYYGWVRRAGIDVAGSLGNHDVPIDHGRYQFRTLGMPGPYYHRRVGPVDLIVLDSNAVDARQTSWLRRTLAEAEARWRVAVFHHPIHTCGRYEERNFDVKEWAPLLDGGVHLVLNGHDHNYQRFEDGPVTYVVAGGGGASLYDLETCPLSGAVQVEAAAVHSFFTLRANGDRLEGRALGVDGALVDSFVLE
jgi:hypothetical protein